VVATSLKKGWIDSEGDSSLTFKRRQVCGYRSAPGRTAVKLRTRLDRCLQSYPSIDMSLHPIAVDR
jgi:hypothetical protein